MRKQAGASNFSRDEEKIKTKGETIKELERIYGIRNGSANEKGDNRIGGETKLPDQKKQSDLAEELNMSKVRLRKYKSLTDLIPELQDAVQTLVK